MLQRLNTYHEQTEPVKAHYEKLGKLKTVEGIGSVEEIKAKIGAVLGVAL